MGFDVVIVALLSLLASVTIAAFFVGMEFQKKRQEEEARAAKLNEERSRG